MLKTAHRARKTKEAVNEYGLTALQEQFCHAYLLKFNVTHASKLIGIGAGQADSWIKSEKVKKRISQIRIDTGKAYDVTRERLMQELMNIIYADMRLVQDKDIVDWPDEETAAVSEVEKRKEFEDGKLTGITEKIKRWDKLRAIEMLNKMLGYNMPDVTKVIPGKPEPMSKEEMLEIAKLLKTAI